MKKKFVAILMSFVMLFSLMPTAFADNTVTVTITPDKTQVEVGDTVNYTIAVHATDYVTGMELVLDIPDGMTFNAGAVANGLRELLNDDDNSIGEVSFTGGSVRKYVINTGALLGFNNENFLNKIVTIGTFSCTANSESGAGYEVGLKSYEITDKMVVPYNDVLVQTTSVTVSAKPVSVTGVSFTNKTLSLDLNKEQELAYTISPGDATNKAVTFFVVGDAVTVTNGKVLGVKEGTATITITTVDGGFTDTCTVTVACSHADKTPVAEKASDCKTQGWDAYVKCNACGQLFAADGTTKIAAIPFRDLDFTKHTGGTATCTAQAICSVCSQPYGDFEPHKYTDTTKKEEALKTKGNCRDYAVYYYSCAVCGAVERNDAHTFIGDKVAATHVGGTTLVNVSEANHKTQIKGYTGDTKCLGCGEIIGYGQEILPSAHVAGTAWFSDGTNHWNVCSVGDCGHTMNLGACAGGTATCMDKATCTTCGNEYGDVNSNNHKAAATWTQITEVGKEYHYKQCDYGCGAQLEKNACSGGTATCVSAATCAVCRNTYGTVDTTNGHDWDMSAWAQNNGTHYRPCKNACGDMTKDADACSGGTATCMSAATCAVCRNTYGGLGSHDWDTSKWEKNENGHWRVCKHDSEHTSTVESHIPDKQGGATEQYGIFCSECNYEIEKQLAHTHNFNQTSTDDKFKVSDATCSSPAVYKYSCSCGAEGTMTFTNGDVNPNNHKWATGWTSDANGHWHACEYNADHKNDQASHGEPVWKYNASTNKHWSECPTCQHKLTAEAAHVDANNDGKCDVCNGTVRKPGGGHYFHFDYNNDGKCDYCGTKVVIDPVESGKTFDGGIALYIGMSIAAATGGAAMVVSKKRKEND